MPTGHFADPNRTRWLVALAAAAGTTLAPTALGQDEDPIAGMLRSITEGGSAGQNAQPNRSPAQQGQGEQDLSHLEGDVSVDENMIVELHVQDEDLGNVLQMLSIQSQRNIVASNNVSATVKANLYGVTFYEALDSILHVNGYGYIEKGNFIYVYTLEELQSIQQAARARVAEAIRLDFLNAIDAAEFVTPLLSEGGFIKTNGRTSEFSVGGDTPVGADDYANGAMLVVFDYPENIDEIKRLIGEIDTRPAQVLVEATIVQTTLNEANAFGVDFSIVGDLNIEDFVNIGGPLSPVDGLLGGVGARQQGESLVPVGLPGDGEGRALQSTPGNTSGRSTLKLGIIDEDISVFVRMLDEVSDTTILSSPKILALNRQPSRVLVGRKVGYLSTTSTETSTTQTVEFLDTGTQLYFRPFVSNDGMIRMELKPQVSEAIIRNQTDATGAAVTIPDEITNEIVTNVLVPDGHTIILGGLFRESTTAERRQVPVLGDLPIIGAAFRGHEDETQRSEIIFLIKPSILADDVLIAQGGRGEDYVRRVRAGSREGLLPWSRERQSSQLLVEAEQLAAEGKTDRALHKVRRALEHNPFQADAISMRERLMNEEAIWPHRNLLHDIVENELFDSPAGQAPTGSMSRGSGANAVAPVSRSTPPSSATSSSRVASSDSALVPTASEQSVPVQIVEQTYVAPSTPATDVAPQPDQQIVQQPIQQPTSVAVESAPVQPVDQPVVHPDPQAVASASTQQEVVTSVTSQPTEQVLTGSFNTTALSAETRPSKSPYADLRPTPIATDTPVSTPSSSGMMAGLTPTLAPEQAPHSFGRFNDPSMRPTGAAVVSSMPPATESVSAPVVTPVVESSAAADPIVEPAATATPSAGALETTTPAAQPAAQAPATEATSVSQAAAEFGLSDSEVQMLVLTEFFRSFGTWTQPAGPFVGVPTDPETPE